MKVSIITVVFNGADTIKSAIDSVLNQTYEDVEYIIIDGLSTDGTIELVKSYGTKISVFVSEKDQGLYDAMNKGIALATGDIIGILNSDDLYIDEHVLKNVINEFKTQDCDSVFADLIYVNPSNLDKVVRYYDSSYFTPERFAYGWMPAHPTFFVKKECYEKYGLYRTDLILEGDFDLLLRFLHVKKISYSYMKQVLVKMRVGGQTTGGLKAIWLIAKEQNQSCRDNGVKTNILKIMSKYPRKIIELFKNKQTLKMT